MFIGQKTVSSLYFLFPTCFLGHPFLTDGYWQDKSQQFLFVSAEVNIFLFEAVFSVLNKIFHFLARHRLHIFECKPLPSCILIYMRRISLPFKLLNLTKRTFFGKLLDQTKVLPSETWILYSKEYCCKALNT